MLLYRRSQIVSPQGWRSLTGQKDGGARRQLPDCAQVVEQIESGLALHTVQLPQVETALSECLEELLRLLTHVLDFHVLCCLIWMTFLKTPLHTFPKFMRQFTKLFFFSCPPPF